MELINFNQNQIKIRKTLFNLEPADDKNVKVARNMDSSFTQIQQVEALIKTLLRLEAIKIGAYERWQPYFNEGLSFEGLLAFLKVFHTDRKFIQRLETNGRTYKKIISQFKNSKRNLKLYEKLKVIRFNCKQLIEELREKISVLQIPIADKIRQYNR